MSIRWVEADGAFPEGRVYVDDYRHREGSLDSREEPTSLAFGAQPRLVLGKLSIVLCTGSDSKLGPGSSADASDSVSFALGTNDSIAIALHMPLCDES